VHDLKEIHVVVLLPEILFEKWIDCSFDENSIVEGSGPNIVNFVPTGPPTAGH
jgi:hypothetical protein